MALCTAAVGTPGTPRVERFRTWLGPSRVPLDPVGGSRLGSGPDVAPTPVLSVPPLSI